MKRIFSLAVCLLLMLIGMQSASAQSRRPIDNTHPLWIIHVDIWNNANPQNVIDLIPEDIKPYVCLNLSLSCAYDKEKNVHTRPQNGILTYRSWASVCCANNMWFTCQPASGGHTHIRDDAEHFHEALDIHESFFKDYPNFLGWNYAEQFWGFGEPGDAYSSKENDRLKLFAELVPMHHKYGGFLTISYCGSIYHQNLNPVAMLKRNSNLYNACKQYPEACLWLYKYTHSACFYNNESTCLSPFVSGLATNYGVRYDNCGFNEGMDFALEHNKIPWKGTYPNSLGLGTVMEQMCINGGAVWDGPELIWNAECFIGDNDYTDSEGYRVRRLKRTPSMNNCWVELFRKVIDGTVPVPTRSEVVNDIKVALVNNNNETTPPYDFYTGLYKQTDPMNFDNGNGDNNRWFLKSTGQYRAVPYLLSSDVPASISIKKNHTDIEGWSTKMADFNTQYPEVRTSGDLFVARRNNTLVTYYPYSYFNDKATASAVIPLKYNTCESVELQYGRFGNGIVQEYGEYVDVYLNNYCEHSRSGQGNNAEIVTEKIIIRGAKERPTVGWYNKTRTSATGAVVNDYAETWENGVYTLSVPHNGAVEIRINCNGNGTGRQQATGRSGLSASDIEQPTLLASYNGPLIIEAEDMRAKNLKHLVLLPYFSGGASEWYPEVKGHSGLGFANMGKTGASLKDVVTKLKTSGIYKIGIRYTADKGAAVLNVKINGETRQIKLSKTNYNEWQTAEIIANLTNGENIIYYTNAGDSEFYIDNVTYRLYGSDEVVEEETEEKTFNYEMDMSSVAEGGFPEGWRADDNGSGQEYSNTYGSGPRTFKNGCTPAVIYWRSGDTDNGVGTLSYGEQENCRLHLKPGTYTAEFVNYYWYNATDSKYTLEISTLAGVSIEKTSEIGAVANPNGDQAKGTFDISQKKTLNFTITEEGDYVAKFTTKGLWKAYVLAYFKITGTYTESSSPSTPPPPTVLSALPGTMRPLTKADFKNWEDEQSDWTTLRLGKTIQPGGLIFGDAQSSFPNYLDVSAYDRICIEGTAGAKLLLNHDRQSVKNSNNKDVDAGLSTEEITIGNGGSVEYSLSGITKLNSVILASNSSSAKVNTIRFIKGTVESASKSLSNYNFGTYNNGTLQSQDANTLVLNNSTNTVFGDGNVPVNRYAVLDGIVRIDFVASVADKGKTVRVLMNRYGSGNGEYTELTSIIGEDGKASIDLSGFNTIHINAIKMPYGQEATFSSVKVVDGALFSDSPLASIASNAVFTKSTSTCTMNLGEQLDAAGLVYGDGNVPHLAYADISGYDKIYLTGTPNKSVRFIFNRQIVEGPTSEKAVTFADDGTAILDISDIKEYAHLHAIKVQWGNNATTVNSISLYSDVKTDEYINYYLFGANAQDEAATSALNDPNATVIDAKLLSVDANATLNGANPNCLYIVDDVQKVNNTENVIVDNAGNYSASSIVLEDGHPFLAPVDITTNNSRYTRNIGDYEWASALIPFEMNAADAGAEIYVMTAVHDNSITLTKVESGTIPANTPIIFRNTSKGATTITGTNVGKTVDGYNLTPVGNVSNWFVCQSMERRIINDVTIDSFFKDYDVYGISADKFVKATKKLTTNPFRSFFLHKKDPAAPANSRFSIAIDDNIVDNIESVDSPSIAIEVARFNAAGQRIDTPVKGVNIIKMSDGTVRKVTVK